MAWPPRAGQIVRASDFSLIPGQRVATETFTSNSVTFTTTQTVVGTIVAPLEIGRTYRVRVVTRFGSTSAGPDEVAAIRLYAGSMGTVGQEITSANVIVLSTSALGWPCDFEVEFVPTATGPQTFTLAGIRTSGAAGTWQMVAAQNRPAYIYVDYVRD